MDAQKEALVSALGHKCRVYIDQKNSDELSKSFDLLREWVDTASDNDHLLLHARKELMEEHYGLAIKALNKLIDGEEAHKDLQEALALKQDYWGNWDGIVGKFSRGKNFVTIILKKSLFCKI
eukprot:jgi/Picre1/27931/NNA_000893.t1